MAIPPRPPVSADQVRNLLNYDPATGAFTWRATGNPAGSLNDRGYIRIPVESRYHRAHRLAWLWMTGEWPEDDVDHENRVRHDNRWANLRPATNGQNQANRLTPGSASGYRGVYWAPHANCWRAELTLRSGGRRVKKVLGYFQDPALAGEFRELAGRMIWGDYYREQAKNLA